MPMLRVYFISGVAVGSVRFDRYRIKREGVRSAMVAAVEYRHAGRVVDGKICGDNVRRAEDDRNERDQNPAYFGPHTAISSN